MADLANSITECPDLTQLWHMYGETKVQLSHSDIGPYVHIVCPAGHHVVGPSMVTCLRGGTWNDVTAPTCSSSSIYGVPESDVILIGVLGGCGAIIILALTIILARLICFRPKNDHKSSTDRLHRSMDNISTTHAYRHAKYPPSISPPTTPSRYGEPMTLTSVGNQRSNAVTGSSGGNLVEDEIMPYYISEQHPHLHTDYDAAQNGNQQYYHHQPRSQPHVSGHVTTVEDHPVFVNHAFSGDLAMDYAARWENEMNSTQRVQLPEYSSVSRTTF